jgi:hypothetical protein
VMNCAYDAARVEADEVTEEPTDEGETTERGEAEEWLSAE